MTKLTRIARVDVGRMLAGRVRTVMAANAVAGNIGVVKVRRYPTISRMTIVAVVATRDVSRVFAGSNRTVMAGETRTDDLRVIHEICRCPDDVVMAVLATVSC